MKRAFLVLGPEASGTRMLTQAFISVGVFGDGDHKQRLDKADFKIQPYEIVWRRSVPHTKKHIYPNLSEMYEKLKVCDYDVFPLIIYREKEITIQSQLRSNHASLERARYNISKGLDFLFTELDKLSLTSTLVSYEIFVEHESYRKHLFSRFNFKNPIIKIRQENNKYYDKIYKQEILDQMNPK